MINWTPFDPENPPECGKEFHVMTKDKNTLTAELDTYYGVSNGTGAIKHAWFSPSGTRVRGITHYAEINLPGDAP